jgi:hypothetical protein
MTHLKYFAAALLLTGTLHAQVPEALRPPKSQVLLMHLQGKGRQIYVCQAAKDGPPVWKFKAPEADLYNETGEKVGHHSAGPTWESADGSKVVGKMVATVPSPTSNAVPWLLLTAVSNTGNGIFSHVQSIQRLDTKGGVSPHTVCTSENIDAETSASYEATYYFYGTETVTPR